MSYYLTEKPYHINMKSFSSFYCISHDIKNFLNRHSKQLFAVVGLFLLGLIIGIVVGNNAESDYSGTFTLILSNEFEPFKSLWMYLAILIFSVLLCLLSAWKKGFISALILDILFIGYIFGRICFFSVTENVFWGIFSIIVFVIPNALILFISVYYVFCKAIEFSFCGTLKNNMPLLIKCGKAIGVSFLGLFAVNIVIGGIINLLINVI